MADQKISGLPQDTVIDDNHYVLLNDPTGPTTKRTLLGTIRLWLAGVAGWITAYNIDFTQFDVYSASETDTGRKWVDGRTIYRKVLRGQVTIINGTASVPHGITGLTLAWELVRVSGGVKFGSTSNSGGQVIVNNHREAAGNWNILDSVDQTNLSFVGSFAWGNSYYEQILEYVK